MRDWKVNPKLLCRQHLLGNHLEVHMFVGTLRRGGKARLNPMDWSLRTPCRATGESDQVSNMMPEENREI